MKIGCKKLKVLLLAVAVVSILVMGSGTALASWTFTNLGTLGGTLSYGYDINAQGRWLIFHEFQRGNISCGRPCRPVNP
jgi:hypothetical protein